MIELAVGLWVGVVSLHRLDLAQEGGVRREREDGVVLARNSRHVLHQLLQVGLLGPGQAEREGSEERCGQIITN